MGDFDRCGVETVPAVSVNSNQTNLATTFDRNSIHKLVFAENGWNLSCVNLNQCLYDTKLVEMPNILPEGNVVSAMTNFASESYQLRRYPDTMDFSHVTTNAANFWNYCNTGQMVEKLPSKMVFPNSLTLSCQFSQMGQIYPDTMARFNEDNELTGGWLYGWTRNAGYTTELSVKFATSPATWMDANQKAEVSAYLHTRGFHIYGL